MGEEPSKNPTAGFPKQGDAQPVLSVRGRRQSTRTAYVRTQNEYILAQTAVRRKRLKPNAGGRLHVEYRKGTSGPQAAGLFSRREVLDGRSDNQVHGPLEELLEGVSSTTIRGAISVTSTPGSAEE